MTTYCPVFEAETAPKKPGPNLGTRISGKSPAQNLPNRMSSAHVHLVRTRLGGRDINEIVSSCLKALAKAVVRLIVDALCKVCVLFRMWEFKAQEIGSVRSRPQRPDLIGPNLVFDQAALGAGNQVPSAIPSILTSSFYCSHCIRPQSYNIETKVRQCKSLKRNPQLGRSADCPPSNPWPHLPDCSCNLTDPRDCAHLVVLSTRIRSVTLLTRTFFCLETYFHSKSV